MIIKIKIKNSNRTIAQVYGNTDNKYILIVYII